MMPLRHVFFLALFGFGFAYGQDLIEGLRPDGLIRLRPSDESVLEARERRTDLPCEVKPTSPVLGYDLSFHAGYEAIIPLRALAGSSNSLTAILRVTPEGSEESFHFSQKWTVPIVEDGARGEVRLPGAFVLGEGNYQIGWLIRDRTERLCAAFWQVSAVRRGKDSQVKMHITPGTAETALREPFEDEEVVPRDTDGHRSVLVLLHVAPQDAGGAEMKASEIQAMGSILRNIVHEGRFTTFSVTAFNIDRRAILYRHEMASNIDLPALGRAVKELHFGTVAVRRLGQNGGGTQFMVDLSAKELANHPDVVILVGPKGVPEDPPLRNSLKQLREPGCPVFYLNFSTERETDSWHDLLSSVVKVWNGVEYSISKPSDLFFAWAGVLSRLNHNPGKLPDTATNLRKPLSLETK